jgi:sulfonate transport system permease protein
MSISIAPTTRNGTGEGVRTEGRPPAIDRDADVAEATVDLSHSHPPENRASSRVAQLVIRCIGPVLIVALWQVAYSLHWLNRLIFSSPGQVASALGGLARSGELQSALEVSLRRAGLGLLIGLTIGISFGLITGLWRIGEKLFDSSLQMLRTVPFIALGPLFLVWFGLGEEPKVLLVAAACIFPNYLNTYAGVRNVDPKLIEAGQILGLSRRALIRSVVLPTALPAILTGVRYSMGVAILALVFAEQINATSGIGYILTNAANNTLDMSLVFAAIAIYAVLGIAIDLIVRTLEKILLPWRPTASAR